MKNEKGYVDFESVGSALLIIITVIVVILFIGCIAGGLRLDFAGGSHRIIPTAIDSDIHGNYRVYYRTTEYTKNSEEDFYYIDKSNTELADEVREYIKQNKEVIVYYDKYVGFKGFTSPAEAPITKIEVIEKEEK